MTDAIAADLLVLFRRRLLPLTNNNGSTVYVGQPVVLDGTQAASFKLASSPNDPNVIGTVWSASTSDSVANGVLGQICIGGIGLAAVSGSPSLLDYIYMRDTDPTNVSNSPTPPQGSYARILDTTNQGNNGVPTATRKALILGPSATRQDVGSNRIGGTSQEATTTSTSMVALISLTVTTTPAGQAFNAVCNFRKTTGAAASLSLGIKLNSTEIYAPAAVTGTGNAAVSGVERWWGRWNRTNYLAAFDGMGNASDATTSRVVAAATMPGSSAALTAFVIEALVGSASITGAVQDVDVFALATA